MHHEELGQEGLGEVALRVQGFMSLGKEAGEVEMGVGVVMAAACEKAVSVKKKTHLSKQT